MSKEGKEVFEYENNEAFEELADGEDPVFASRVRFLVFAASVGFARDRKVETPDKDRYIRWSYIEGDSTLSMVTSALSYAVTDDPEVILDPNRKMTVLRQYGAGGARLVKQHVVDEPGDNLDNLIHFLQEHRDTEEMTARIGVLEEIEQEFGSFEEAE